MKGTPTCTFKNFNSEEYNGINAAELLKKKQGEPYY